MAQNAFRLVGDSAEHYHWCASALYVVQNLIRHSRVRQMLLPNIFLSAKYHAVELSITSQAYIFCGLIREASCLGTSTAPELLIIFMCQLPAFIYGRNWIGSHVIWKLFQRTQIENQEISLVARFKLPDLVCHADRECSVDGGSS